MVKYIFVQTLQIVFNQFLFSKKRCRKLSQPFTIIAKIFFMFQNNMYTQLLSYQTDFSKSQMSHIFWNCYKPVSPRNCKTAWMLIVIVVTVVLHFIYVLLLLSVCQYDSLITILYNITIIREEKNKGLIWWNNGKKVFFMNLPNILLGDDNDL